jgi:TPR repeat protein
MKRAFLAICCGAALFASSVAYAADPVSDKEMADRYTQAAQSGDSDAQFYLAALYSSAVGRARSDEEAFKWFSRAADQGHSHAMLVLSGLYAIGRGVSKDNLSAYRWAYIVSAGTKVDEYRNGSRQLMGVLETRMSPADIRQAKDEAGRWHAVSSPAKPAASNDTGKRDYPVSPAPSAQAPASPASKSADSTNLPGPRATSGKDGKDGKKDDMNSILDQVPGNLRKRFGF